MREQVSLQVGNVLDPALASRDGLYDFVFCRNLLIYFDVPTQQRVFEVLKRLLHPQGVLFIGPAEGSLLARLGMRPLGIAQSFAYVREEGGGAALVTPPVQPSRGAVPTLAKPGSLQPSAALPRPLRVLPVAAKPAPAREHRREEASELLASIARLANAGASEPARAECQRYWTSSRLRRRCTTGLGCSAIPRAMHSRH